MLSPEIQPGRELFAYEDDLWVCAINQIADAINHLG
jgi:hypothetical protein